VDAKRGGRVSKPRGPKRGARQPDDDDYLDTVPVAPGHPFAKLAALRTALSPRGETSAPARAGSPAWVEEAVAATHEALQLEADGRIVYSAMNRALAQIARGSSIALPDVRLIANGATDFLAAGAQQRVQRRVLAFARDVVTELLGGLRELASPAEASARSIESAAALRALVHRLEHGLGTALSRDLEDVLDVLDADARAVIANAQLVVGPVVVYAPAGLTASATAARVALATTWYGAGRALRPPAGGAVSFAASRGIDRDAYAAIGYPVFAGRAVRADLVARVASRIAQTPPSIEEIATWLGCSARDAKRVVEAIQSSISTTVPSGTMRAT
jgi:ATP-dependent RNA helicase SUPV3L1/SUV3